jgi:hypothetical protein
MLLVVMLDRTAPREPARMLADLVDERRPDIDPTPYSPISRNRHR